MSEGAAPVSRVRDRSRVRIGVEAAMVFKPHLCLYIAFSAAFGHILALGKISSVPLAFGAAVFVLACGSALLNNIQDRQWDGFFERTRNRALPQNRIDVRTALFFSVFLIFVGLWGIGRLGGVWPVMAGIAAIVSYNGLYTPLKKHTLFSLVPGSLSGMLPPFMGWVAAGGYPPDLKILSIMAVFGIWQMLHCFIFYLIHPASCPGQSFSISKTGLGLSGRILRHTLIWAGLYSVSISGFALAGGFKSPVSLILTLSNAALLFFSLRVFLKRKDRLNPGIAFGAANLSILFFMAAGILDALRI